MFGKFIKLLSRAKLMLFVLILFSFITSFFITSFVVNNNYSYYRIEVEGDNPALVFTKENLESLEAKITKYNDDIASGVIEGKKLFLSSQSKLSDLAKNVVVRELDNNHYIIDVKMKAFATTFMSKSQKISEGISKCERTMISIFDSNVDGIENENVKITSRMEHVGFHNPYLIATYTTIGVIVLLFILLIVGLKYDKPREEVIIYDNEEIFRTPFHKKYWIKASRSLSKVKNIAIVAVLFALMMACKAIPLPTGFGVLGISLTYLFFSVIAMIYGPITGIFVGMISDVLGHFIFPPGMPFFPGYTLDSMLAGFTYGIFFYKTKISFSKCLLARLIVNLFINTLLGSIWWAVINDFTFDAYITYMMLISLPKNLLFLLPQSILLFVVLKALANPLKHTGLVDYRICDNVTII